MKYQKKKFNLNELKVERKLFNIYIVGFNVNNTNLKEILLTKYEDSDEKEIESLNEHLDEFDLEYKFDNKKIKVKKNKKKIKNVII